MPTKILLIENDSAFASQLSESLEASGYDVRVSPEGKSGLDQAREWGPSGIVLCVELPGMAGYVVCQKLRKDDATKAIPLVLTSAEATADTFEKHKVLKVRADEYLLKPYVPQALLEKLAAIGLPAPAPVEDELAGLGDDEPAARGASSELPSLDLETLPDEPAPSAEPAELSLDDDLAFLDEAFEGIAAPEAPRAAHDAPVGEEDLSAAAASLPAEDEAAARDELGDLGDLDMEGEDPLAGLEETVAPLPGDALQAAALELTAEPPAEDPQVRGASAEALRAAGIPLSGQERPAARPTPAPIPSPTAAPIAPPAPVARPTLSGLPIPGSLRSALASPPPAGPATPSPAGEPAVLQRELVEARAAATAREGEARQLRARAEEAARRADTAEAAAAEHEAELASVRARLEAITAQARKADQELKAAREEGRRAVDEIETLRARATEAERRAEELAAQAARIDELERELESARTELVVARGEVEGARGEVEARAAELQKQISDLEAQGAKNEERVLKAYQKIKGDEKVKDRVRKALAIAAQLLEEGLPAEQAPVEKERLS
jgi:CheY-like chemotaxis protein